MQKARCWTLNGLWPKGRRIYMCIYVSIRKNRRCTFRGWKVFRPCFRSLFRSGKLWLKRRPKCPPDAPKSTKNLSRASFFHLQRLWETRRRRVTHKSPSRAVPKANIWCSVQTERHFSAFLLDPRKLAKDLSRASRWDLKCTPVW